MKEYNVLDLDKRIFDKKIEDIKQLVSKNRKFEYVTIISVGNNDASKLYVRNKKRLLEEVGLDYVHKHYDYIDKCSSAIIGNIIEDIKVVNKDNNCLGAILQLPLPDEFGYATDAIISNLDSKKDLDGLTPNSNFVACTPLGIYNIIKELDLFDLKTVNMTIIGRGKLVGRPLADLMLDKVGSLSVFGSNAKKEDISNAIKSSDIVVTCVGGGKLSLDIKHPDDIKTDSLFIDAGINRVDGKQYGDLDLEEMKYLNCLVTPRIGGVGKATCLALIENATKNIGNIGANNNLWWRNKNEQK